MPLEFIDRPTKDGTTFILTNAEDSASLRLHTRHPGPDGPACVTGKSSSSGLDRRRRGPCKLPLRKDEFS